MFGGSTCAITTGAAAIATAALFGARGPITIIIITITGTGTGTITGTAIITGIVADAARSVVSAARLLVLRRAFSPEARRPLAG